MSKKETSQGDVRDAQRLPYIWVICKYPFHPLAVWLYKYSN